MIWQALQYIGDNGIVYRDLKLENILISETQNSVFLADFGLAKNLRGSSKTSTICGTIQYMGNGFGNAILNEKVNILDLQPQRFCKTHSMGEKWIGGLQAF